MEDKETQKEIGHIQFVEETVVEGGSSLMTFEVDAAATKLISSVGLRFIVTCAAYGLDLEDGFKAVSDRGEYLSQEPDTRDRGKMMKPKKGAPAGGYGGNNNKDNRPTGQKEE
jgi:hypothetical protein